ncbi:MAG: TIGR01459 family HAD-type hydrolase [Hyphomicrobiaceae bacterium]
MSERDGLARDVPIIESLAAIAGRYDALLCDVWGVVHNGLEPFEPASRALTRFRETGGTVVLITNAPRPFGPVVQQLDRIGVPRTAYDAVVTSGDVTRALIVREGGGRIFHLGPRKDLGIYEGLEVARVEEAAATAVVCTGFLGDDSVGEDTETPDEYRDMLLRFKARGLAMICANPDIVVERGSELVYCAGALAAAYEKIGGRVLYAGKPHGPIYEEAIARVASLRGDPVAKARLLAIGDGLRTDMAGAEAYGLDALFIPSGVHVASGRELDQALIAELFRLTRFRPVAAIDELKW